MAQCQYLSNHRALKERPIILVIVRTQAYLDACSLKKLLGKTNKLMANSSFMIQGANNEGFATDNTIKQLEYELEISIAW